MPININIDCEVQERPVKNRQDFQEIFIDQQ
jgi:hypothetical protein